ncbi:CDP-archaeol synthase [Pendulispora albinea]|uniref:CDP-archaeol synthase n=1 Tax=Pendulispora albinea TaxID=2741071 RepID=A0ABZ2LLI7_9BACT
MILLRILWLLAPLIAAGVLQVIVIRARLFPSLAWPIDRGLRVRGTRLFGDHKTFRGFVVMIGGTALFFGLQVLASHRSAALCDLGFVDYRHTTWWLHGSIYGAGYVVGELPNSFLKRQLAIAEGAKGSGVLGSAFLVLDQVDGVFGILVSMCAFYVPTLRIAGLAFGVLTIVHVVVFNVVLVLIGVKSRVF